MKTERLAEQHFKRVSNFAKEMLVWPEEIDVHRIKNSRFISEVKPTQLEIDAFENLPQNNNNSVDLGHPKMGAALRQSPVQPPMKFGSH